MPALLDAIASLSASLPPAFPVNLKPFDRLQKGVEPFADDALISFIAGSQKSLVNDRRGLPLVKTSDRSIILAKI